MSVNVEKDPIGFAVQEYSERKAIENITVRSNYCEDDVLPVSWLFRTYEQMPELEQKALDLSRGTILDVGSGAGCHSKHLVEKKLNVMAIDVSVACVEYQKKCGINALSIDFFELSKQQYDTVLMLMNGIGICGNLNRLPQLLEHAYGLLKEGGQLLCDSTDVHYLYEEEDGSEWLDLNASYFGDFKFQMQYKNVCSDWFDWLYVDAKTLQNYAEKIGFKVEIYKGKEHEYLAKLTKS